MEGVRPHRAGKLVRIADARDARLDDYRSLKDPARGDPSEGQVFVLEGRRSLEVALVSGAEIVSVLLEERRAARLSHLVEALEACGASVYVASSEVVAGTVGFDLHRGVVAIARRSRPARAEDVLAKARSAACANRRRPLVAVLEALNDHENLGVLFRSAAAFGLGGVLIDPRCADPLYRRSVRVSLGHVLTVPFARLSALPGGLDVLQDAGFVLCALAPASTDANWPRGSLSLRAFAEGLADDEAVALLLGAEGPGLSKEVLAAAHTRVAIPMAPGVDSLNVATAASIAFYELTQARSGS
jgi:tRNA G18 (ribose-2'-O)-methylase SpoU